MAVCKKQTKFNQVGPEQGARASEITTGAAKLWKGKP